MMLDSTRVWVSDSDGGITEAATAVVVNNVV